MPKPEFQLWPRWWEAKEIILTTVFLHSSRVLNVLEVIAPFKHFNKLKEFVAMKLPPGFPVRIGEFYILYII